MSAKTYLSTTSETTPIDIEDIFISDTLEKIVLSMICENKNKNTLRSFNMEPTIKSLLINSQKNEYEEEKKIVSFVSTELCYPLCKLRYENIIFRNQYDCLVAARDVISYIREIEPSVLYLDKLDLLFFENSYEYLENIKLFMTYIISNIDFITKNNIVIGKTYYYPSKKLSDKFSHYVMVGKPNVDIIKKYLARTEKNTGLVFGDIDILAEIMIKKYWNLDKIKFVTNCAINNYYIKRKNDKNIGNNIEDIFNATIK